MPQYPDYRTFIRYKNCCRPIGDTGPPGPDGPTGPAGPTISGNKGEILYFSETDTLDSSNTIFITNGNVTINNNLVVTGNLSMNDNFINDVSGIYFSDATYIGHGSSFDITTSETLDISASGGINLNTDVTINSDITINSNLTANTIHTQRLLFPAGNYIDYQDGIGELYVNGNTTLAHRVQLFSTLDVSGATTIRSNLSMNNNFINDVSGIYFTQGNLLFSDFSSVNQSVQLPSSQGQPISLERKTLFYHPNFNLDISGSPVDISFVTPTFNQLGLIISGSGNTIIFPSPDISGQYVEIYSNFLVNSSNGNSKTIALDISGVSSGSLFNETIDVRTISKKGSYYITFGPHIFTPEQWSDTSEFVITANTSDNFTIEEYRLMFKSYFM